MKKIITISALSISLFLSTLNGQPGGSDPSALLNSLFGRLAAGGEDREKIRINDSIRLMIDSYVRSDSVLSNNFSRQRYLGQILSPDSRLKIITWNLLLNDSPSEYFCYFILKSGNENKIYNLTTSYRPESIRTDTAYSEKNWYGALYYDLRPLKQENRGSYMLLGINYGNPSITRKIIDVLSFNPEGGLTFGKKMFADGNEMKFREVLEYSHTAVITLRFLSEKMIVFDHLVPVDPAMKGNREFYAPDFSYDAYEFEKGLWRFKQDVDVRNIKKRTLK